ncbi:hypothetical protein BU24DRAFT_101967 [Aaosphaeria arxii CBS 175.79]|uniref:Methyltransferase domain-containing protein n=1 Tax=Aaosphaeria arxii CBS 175.79 TaxID=1450172 RepID=A0A6A5XZE3_9PLEO|nr:uncharacterized protein BU24DRAFT_101967 [Aaosphaeria arxii CBS 175.79]KAF2018678.1 hypothetical protein BU24DRAFT_101967 [Aaosphaeria arxii CBS 175.79]
MAPQPPSFGSQKYWETRFASNSQPFEWLEAPSALDTYLLEAFKTSGDKKPEILHIGCGTSLLSHHLCELVGDPERIHNIDYSPIAIDIGKKREIEAHSTHTGQEPPGSPPKSPQPKYMRWSAIDLLDPNSLLEVCNEASYSVFVDKSTSDSISCADDVDIKLPYSINTSKSPIRSGLNVSPEAIHPLHILAIHLAFLAKPKARWLALSYSLDRFPFLQPPLKASGTGSSRTDDLDDIPKNIIDNGLPDPALLWKLIKTHEIEVPSEQPNQPKISHLLYILQRTDVPLFVIDQSIDNVI